MTQACLKLPAVSVAKQYFGNLDKQHRNTFMEMFSLICGRRWTDSFNAPHNEQSLYIIQWNLRTRDTLWLIVLSLVERLSLSLR